MGVGGNVCVKVGVAGCRGRGWVGVGGNVCVRVGVAGCRGRGWVGVGGNVCVRGVWLGVGERVGGCRGECMCEGGCGWV